MPAVGSPPPPPPEAIPQIRHCMHIYRNTVIKTTDGPLFQMKFVSYEIRSSNLQTSIHTTFGGALIARIHRSHCVKSTHLNELMSTFNTNCALPSFILDILIMAVVRKDYLQNNVNVEQFKFVENVSNIVLCKMWMAFKLICLCMYSCITMVFIHQSSW